MMPTPPSGDADAQRALWRSRRGMLELDLLLSRFAERSYPRLGKADQHAYLELLRMDDWRIWDWLQSACGAAVASDGRPPAQGGDPPPHLARIVTLIAADAGAHGEQDRA